MICGTLYSSWNNCYVSKKNLFRLIWEVFVSSDTAVPAHIILSFAFIPLYFWKWGTGTVTSWLNYSCCSNKDNTNKTCKVRCDGHDMKQNLWIYLHSAENSPSLLKQNTYGKKCKSRQHKSIVTSDSRHLCFTVTLLIHNGYVGRFSINLEWNLSEPSYLFVFSTIHKPRCWSTSYLKIIPPRVSVLHKFVSLSFILKLTLKLVLWRKQCQLECSTVTS